MKPLLKIALCLLVVALMAPAAQAQCNCSSSTSQCGGSGSDTLIGTSASNCIDGNGGHDTIEGRAGHDDLYGGSGDDTLCGDSGNDDLFGEGGDDWLGGGSGSDSLNGGSGSDTELQNGECDDSTGDPPGDPCPPSITFSCEAYNGNIGGLCPPACVTNDGACGFCTQSIGGLCVCTL